MEKKVISKEDRLKQVPLFSNLHKKNLAEIAHISDVVEVPAGEVLVEEGGRGDQFIMILEGEAKVTQNGEVVNRLSENDFFGEIALVAHRRRAATVTAETPMKVLVVPAGYFSNLLEQTPGLWKEIAIAMSHYIPPKI